MPISELTKTRSGVSAKTLIQLAHSDIPELDGCFSQPVPRGRIYADMTILDPWLAKNTLRKPVQLVLRDEAHAARVASVFIETAQPYEPLSGIYFLVEAGQVVYVGKSKHVQERIAQHREYSRFSFDGYSVEPCSPGDLARREAYYIRLLQPKHNSIGGGTP